MTRELAPTPELPYRTLAYLTRITGRCPKILLINRIRKTFLSYPQTKITDLLPWKLATGESGRAANRLAPCLSEGTWIITMKVGRRAEGGQWRRREGPGPHCCSWKPVPRDLGQWQQSLCLRTPHLILSGPRGVLMRLGGEAHSISHRWHSDGQPSAQEPGQSIRYRFCCV